jgi:hypothetical protein
VRWNDHKSDGKKAVPPSNGGLYTRLNAVGWESAPIKEYDWHSKRMKANYIKNVGRLSL